MPRKMLVALCVLLGLPMLLVALLAVMRVREIREEERRPMPTATPDPRQDPAWLRTPGGQLYARNRALFPSREREVWDAIAGHQLAIGWTASQCEESWGKPDHVNRTTTALGSREQWCYGEMCQSALYLDNGVLTAIQN